ncbi:hypothetical protein [Cellulomonas sp. URHB0016]
MSPLYPWPTYREPWDLEIEAVEIDGQDSTALADAARYRIELDGREWTNAALRVRAHARDSVDGLVPTAGYVMVSTRQSASRASFVLTPDGSGWVGTVHLTKDTLAGKSVVEAHLTARIGDRLRVIARSHSWDVVADAGSAPRPPGAPPLDFTWVDFRKPDAPELARLDPAAYCVVDVTDGGATLLLNEGIEGFKEILYLKSPKLEKRRLQDLLGADVARQATTALLRAAVDEVASTADDDDAQLPGNSRLVEVLDAVSSGMGLNSTHDLVARIATARTIDERNRLWADMDTTVARLTGVSSALALACKGAIDA